MMKLKKNSILQIILNKTNRIKKGDRIWLIRKLKKKEIEKK